jgi:ketosteroid isomerase-like protein
MQTTNVVLDQHLKCFYENDLDGVVADYSSDAVLFVPDRPLKTKGGGKDKCLCLLFK